MPVFAYLVEGRLDPSEAPRNPTEPPGSFPIPRLPEDGCLHGTGWNLLAQPSRANACLAPQLAPRGVFCVLAA